MRVLTKKTIIVKVWLAGGRIFKSQPKFMADTEYHFLRTLEKSGYVPRGVRREDLGTISMEYVENESVTDPAEFLSHYLPVLKALTDAGCRHGDLTPYAVLVRSNKPVIIDFAEARYRRSPMRSKRHDESDMVWLKKTMLGLASVAE